MSRKPVKQYPPHIVEGRERARLVRHEKRFSPPANMERARARIERALLRGAQRTLRLEKRRFTIEGYAAVSKAAKAETADMVQLGVKRILRHVRRTRYYTFDKIKKLVG